jgi:hypothetical protein
MGLLVYLGGYLELTVGWVEGIELNFFGAVLGLEARRPALSQMQYFAHSISRKRFNNREPTSRILN